MRARRIKIRLRSLQNVNEQANYRSITQLPLPKFHFTLRRLARGYDRNTHIRSTSCQDGYQLDAEVGYG